MGIAELYTTLAFSVPATSACPVRIDSLLGCSSVRSFSPISNLTSSRLVQIVSHITSLSLCRRHLSSAEVAAPNNCPPQTCLGQFQLPPRLCLSAARHRFAARRSLKIANYPSSETKHPSDQLTIMLAACSILKPHSFCYLLSLCVLSMPSFSSDRRFKVPNLAFFVTRCGRNENLGANLICRMIFGT